MKQEEGKILPKFINTDASYESLKPDESPFVKGLSHDINANPGYAIGTNNPSGEGQNMVSLTPVRSNVELTGIELPSGYNKNCGTFESSLTRELYYFNFNRNGSHGIYVIDGDTGLSRKVVEDQELDFSEAQSWVTTTRVMLRIVRSSGGEIIEKHLMWTNGKKWHGWINVEAAAGSNGFDTSLYPYWTVKQPHFDRRELLEWVVRSPMYKPTVATIPNDSGDSGKNNLIADKNIRFAYDFLMTDGRKSELSPYSLPLQVKTDSFSNNIDSLPKKASVKMYAGSPLVEKIRIYIQRADSTNSIDPTSVYGDWILYDTINKFDDPPTGNYWERSNPWPDLGYDPVMNTIEYVFDNSRSGIQVSQQDALRLQTDMPQISMAATDIDDAVLLCNNRYGYDNVRKSVLDNLSAEVVEKDNTNCSLQMRTVYLYAYIGCPDAIYNWSYMSQPAWTYGEDTKVRFGSFSLSMLIGTPGYEQSKFFGLDFADRSGPRVYLKGTPYYADGELYLVRQDNSLEKVDKIYDFNIQQEVREAYANIENGSYYIYRFKLVVPAGRYIAAMGRHNVDSNKDWRGQSTYVYGIANSRVKSTTNIGANTAYVTLKPNAIVTYSKEMEIDCVSGNLDVWGANNNQDVFYIYCPEYASNSNNPKFRMIEGYFKESRDSNIPVELFPYFSSRNNFDDWGKETDKNGFYWGFTRASDTWGTNVQIRARVNCGTFAVWNIETASGGNGWKKNADSFLETFNGGVVGDCNRIIFTGSVRDLTGTFGYSNIAVSMKDGPTVLTRQDGTFTMYVHNGRTTQLPAGWRTSNVYVNAAGNFLLTTQNCDPMPITAFSESLTPCVSCQLRTYPVPLNVQVLIPDNTETSLKQGGRYSVGIAVADLAGRITFVNRVSDLGVETFAQRGNTRASYFRMLISQALNFASENPDFKWFVPYVSKNTASRRYLQWVGDSILYLDNDGNETADPASASFVKIIIQSLYDSNIRSNFTLLSNYQFSKGDRVRIMDDGDGNLLSPEINAQVLGTNYNQAAINAGIIPGTIVGDSGTDVGLIVRYDGRFDAMLDKTGFWVEVYTPVQENEVVPYFECAGFWPLINGRIAEFTGFSNGQPTYNFPTSIDISFWDTYFLQRSILGKYYNHAFESENVTDSWGKNITSGGRINTENRDAAQRWYGGDIIRSDAFHTLNGLATFRAENRKDYGIYPFGEILAAITKRNIIAFVCQSDWFAAEFNMPYTRVGNDGQIVITNLDTNLSLPRQKSGPMFGIEREDLETIVVDDDYLFWFDRKNTAYVKCNFQSAIDVTQENQQGGERGGLQSYLNAKTVFINEWNQGKPDRLKFDVVAGLDAERGNIYLTFRPRRDSSDPRSFVNQRRNLELGSQETFQYSIEYRAWLPCAHFCPESYARLRGKWANVEMFGFAGGKPYYHNGTSNDSFLNYYGIQCEPIAMVVLSKGEDVKIFQSLSYDCHGSALFVDYVFDEQTSSYSQIPSALWKEREHIFYAPFMRDMASYPPQDPDQSFRSMLIDGKRIFGTYCVVRLVQVQEDLGKYFQFSDVSYLFTNSHPNKP